MNAKLFLIVLAVFALANGKSLAQTDATASKNGPIKMIQTFDASHKLVSEYLQTPDGKTTGITYLWFSSGELKAIIPYDNGLMTGTILLFYKGRVIKSECRRSGILDGPSMKYYMSGMIERKQVFLDGKQVGPTLYYDEKGNLLDKKDPF